MRGAGTCAAAPAAQPAAIVHAASRAVHAPLRTRRACFAQPKCTARSARSPAALHAADARGPRPPPTRRAQQRLAALPASVRHVAVVTPQPVLFPSIPVAESALRFMPGGSRLLSFRYCSRKFMRRNGRTGRGRVGSSAAGMHVLAHAHAHGTRVAACARCAGHGRTRDHLSHQTQLYLDDLRGFITMRAQATGARATRWQ